MKLYAYKKITKKADYKDTINVKSLCQRAFFIEQVATQVFPQLSFSLQDKWKKILTTHAHVMSIAKTSAFISLQSRATPSDAFIADLNHVLDEGDILEFLSESELGVLKFESDFYMHFSKCEPETREKIFELSARWGRELAFAILKSRGLNEVPLSFIYGYMQKYVSGSLSQSSPHLLRRLNENEVEFEPRHALALWLGKNSEALDLYNQTEEALMNALARTLNSKLALKRRVHSDDGAQTYTVDRFECS